MDSLPGALQELVVPLSLLAERVAGQGFVDLQNLVEVFAALPLARSRS